jgi:HdeA/HdeB family
MTRWYLVPVLSLPVLFGTSAKTQAQETIDVAKITCEQFLMGQVADSRSISIWLSGFYNGARNNTVLNVNALQKNSQDLMDYCLSHSNVILMDAVTALFGKKN